MVIYDLECVLGHRFEGWFPSAQTFEDQKEKGIIFCALCGANTVHKIPSGGHVSGSPKETKETKETHVNVDPVTLVKAVDHYVKTHFKNVGPKFAEQALAIHEGKKEKEPIYGTATEPERDMLDEEGVAFSTLPKLPESS